MKRKDEFAPMEFVKDGKLTRRTFVKGAGWITVTSALGFGLASCAPDSEPPAKEDATSTTDPDEGMHLCARMLQSQLHIALSSQSPYQRRQDRHSHPG